MSTPRSIRAGALLASLASLALVGCIKMSEKTVLSKDGSGTATVTMKMNKEKLKELEEMAKGFGGGAAEGGPLDSMNVEEMKKKLAGKEGIEVVSVEPIDDEQDKGVKAVVKYKSLEQYYKANLTNSSEAFSVTLSEKEGVWTLTREGKGQKGEENEQMMAMMAPMLAGLEVSVSLELPGTIVETNGTKNEAGNGVSWTVTDKDLTNKEKVAALTKMTVSFKGEGLALKAFQVDVAPAKEDGPAAPGGEKKGDKEEDEEDDE